MTDKQQALVKAAIQIVADQGMSRLTIRNVASSVGVTEPAVYRHFSSKLSLMEAILAQLQQAIRPKFALLFQEELTVGQRLYAFIHNLFTELEEKPEFAFFLFSEEVFHHEPKLKAVMHSMVQENLHAFEQTFREFQKKGLCRGDVNPADLAVMLMGTLRLTVSQWCFYREEGRSLLSYAQTLSDSYEKLLKK